MFARQESMKKNLPSTYDWVFDGILPFPDEDEDKDKDDGEYEGEELRGRILRWLCETGGAPVFWISGKP